MNKITKFFVLVAILAAICTKVSHAQQLPMYSQYMLNPYLINPAVAGTTDYFDFKAGYRYQWVGLKDPQTGESVGPQTFYATGHGHIGKEHQRLRGRHRNQNTWHHGLGGQLVVDKTGPTSMTSFMGTYAYDFNINKSIRLSVAAQIGIKQFALDAGKIRLSTGEQGVGNVPIQQLSPFIMPDAAIGGWLYHKLWFAGLSIQQLFMNQFGQSYYQTNVSGSSVVNRLTQHYFIYGGGIFHPNREIAIIPSVLVKSVFGAFQGSSFDLNVKVRYMNFVWGGLSFRNSAVFKNSDSFSVFLGVLAAKRVEVGYSYDYALNALNVSTSGSHEIMVGYRFEPNAHIISPSDFW
ncbi:MAG: type IX secretion system membrane protein PorP/SprF [Bacteroidota bacterium]|nr:type IX secretion system membrane protein PorP/SprF [Bacteroidota bacterium]